MKTLSELIAQGAKRHPDPTKRTWIIVEDNGQSAQQYQKCKNYPEMFELTGTIRPNSKSPLEFLD